MESEGLVCEREEGCCVVVTLVRGCLGRGAALCVCVCVYVCMCVCERERVHTVCCLIMCCIM